MKIYIVKLERSYLSEGPQKPQWFEDCSQGCVGQDFFVKKGRQKFQNKVGKNVSWDVIANEDSATG